MTAKEVSWMTNKQLAEKLDLFNRWRKGDCPFEEPGCNTPIEPTDLGMIIDEVIKRLNAKIRISVEDEAF